MNIIRLKLANTLLITTAIIGLLMAMVATGQTQAIDATAEPTAEATENPSDGPDVEPTPAGDEAEKAPETEAGTPSAGDQATAIENPAKEDPIGTGTAMIQALRDGAWLVGFGFALLLAVFFTRESLIFFNVAWAKTKPGGFIIAFVLAEGTAFGLAFSVGAGFSFALLVAASGAAWLAAGQHGHIKDVLDWMRGKND